MKYCQQCNKPFYGEEEWKRLCFDCWKRNKNIQPLEKPGLTIELDLLTKLIYLSHPDKHGQSTLSNEVSKYLLTMKKSLS